MNVPVGKLFANQETKELKSLEERRKIFEEAGVDLEKNFTFSCGAGVAAAVSYNATLDISSKGSVYDGSWSEFNARNK